MALVVCVGGLLAFSSPSAPATDSQGQDTGSLTGPVKNTPDNYTNGVAIGGDFVQFAKNGTISRGANQAHWTNNTGRTVFVSPEDTVLGFTSGTASSSWNFYVSTTTSTSVTDFARPTGSQLLIDGARISTSTGVGGAAIARHGTTTASGVLVAVPNGSSIVFNVQEAYACKAVGVCETATSTNRGVTDFFWRFVGYYKP